MARLIIVEDNHELASLVASAARQRGHSAVTAHTGEAALVALGLPRFDLAVVDLLLPDMRGSDVLAEIRKKGMPAIAVSGVFKGERFAREAVEVHGAAAFFEKPFEMHALLAKIDALVGEDQALIAAQRAGSDDEELAQLEELAPIDDGSDEPMILPVPEKAPEDARPIVVHMPAPDPADAGEPQPPPASQPEPDALQGLDESAVDSAFDEISVGPIGRERQANPGSPPVEPEARAGLQFAKHEAVWTTPAEADAVVPRKDRALPSWSQAGDLSQSSVPRLLTAYYQARHDGELKLSQGNVLKVVFFENGEPVYAASNLASERFGRFCMRKGVLDQAQLIEVAQRVKELGVRTGEAMSQLGYLDADRRKQLLEDQIRELIWSTFAWDHGRYEFFPRRPTRTDVVKLSVFPGDLILQGVQRSETLVGLRQKMPGSRRLFPSADPPYGLHEIALSGELARLLVQADGSKTVDDLIAIAEAPEREVLAALVGFECLGLLVERHEENKRRRISFGL